MLPLSNVSCVCSVSSVSSVSSEGRVSSVNSAVYGAVLPPFLMVFFIIGYLNKVLFIMEYFKEKFFVFIFYT